MDYGEIRELKNKLLQDPDELEKLLIDLDKHDYICYNLERRVIANHHPDGAALTDIK